MNWFSALASPITKLIGGVVDIFKTKQDRKKLAESAKAKLSQSIQDGQQKVTLTDAEWEAISAHGLNDSWKDEYVTILITSPLAMLVIGSVCVVFFDDARLVTAGVESIKALTTAGIDMGFMMQTVVLAAVGLKVWRKS
ncbi:hypothetical protein [Neptunicella sp.]|uniref:hypothetical protein n=1 Tax=Neptunicella sp. TaxID=2125986 RepID=UPI003F690C40